MEYQRILAPVVSMELQQVQPQVAQNAQVMRSVPVVIFLLSFVYKATTKTEVLVLVVRFLVAERMEQRLGQAQQQ